MDEWGNKQRKQRQFGMQCVRAWCMRVGAWEEPVRLGERALAYSLRSAYITRIDTYIGRGLYNYIRTTTLHVYTRMHASQATFNMLVVSRVVARAAASITTTRCTAITDTPTEVQSRINGTSKTACTPSSFQHIFHLYPCLGLDVLQSATDPDRKTDRRADLTGATPRLRNECCALRVTYLQGSVRMLMDLNEACVRRPELKINTAGLLR